MPTSLECVQYVPTMPSFGHSRRFSSDPLQPILVKNTGPLPVPNFELEVGYSANPMLYRKAHVNMMRGSPQIMKALLVQNTQYQADYVNGSVCIISMRTLRIHMQTLSIQVTLVIETRT